MNSPDRLTFAGAPTSLPRMRQEYAMKKSWLQSMAIAMVTSVLAMLGSTSVHAQGAIANGETLNGAITSAADSDTWTFSASSGDAIVIRVGEITQTGSFAPRIRLFSPSAALLATASGAVASEIAVTAASNGTFSIVVDDAAATATGTYRLSLAKTGSGVVVTPGDEGGALTNGAMHTGVIDVGDLDVWTVTAAVGESIVVRMGEVTASSTLSPQIRIYSPTGGLLGSTSNETVAAEVVVTAASAGAYLVVVSSQFSTDLSGSGSYRLTLAKTGSAVTVSPGDEGGPLTNGAMHTGVIDVGDLDLWTVTAAVGESIVVRMGEITASSTLSPQIRIYAPTGGLLDSTSNQAVTAEVAVTAASAGTYLVVVSSQFSTDIGGTGSYRLTLAKTGSAVTVSPGDEGGPLSNGAMHTGVIDVGDLDLWTVTAAVGESIVVRMGEITASSTLSPQIRIYSPTGGLLDSTSNQAVTSEVAVTAASAGTYLVVVSSQFSTDLSGTGSYRLTLAKTGSAVTVSPGDEGGALTNGALHTGVIDVGDLDVWTVTAAVGESIVVRMGETSAGSTLSPQIRIYAPTGGLLSSTSNQAAASEVAVTAASAGTYLIVVSSQFSTDLSGAGGYRLTLAKTGSAVTVSPGDEGGPMTNGAMHTGVIDVGDLDVWTVNAALGESIVVRMGETSVGSTLSPQIRIYAPTGGLLDSTSNQATASEVAVTTASAGTYLIVVSSQFSTDISGSGGYRLTLAKTGSPVTVTPGDEGGPLPTGMSTGVIDVGDLDVYTIGAKLGDQIVVQMDELSVGSPLSPSLRLYAPAGGLVANNSNAATAQISVAAAANGTYLLVVGDANVTASGGYRLTKGAGTATGASLTNLVLSKGTLVPDFAANTTNYVASIVDNDNTITVTPTLSDLTATVKVNGVVVASGTPSQAIALNVGNNPISVVVTAQDGVTTKTYTVTVGYAAPAFCTYSLAPPDLSNRLAAGGAVDVIVTTPPGCPVAATSFQPWVVVNSVTPNGATTTVSLQISPNAGPARKTAIVLADRLFLVTQLAP